MKVISWQQVLRSEDIDREDNGAAIIWQPTEGENPKQTSEDRGLFVRLHSYDEQPHRFDYHDLFYSLIGKCVKITVEVIE